MKIKKIILAIAIIILNTNCIHAKENIIYHHVKTWLDKTKYGMLVSPISMSYDNKYYVAYSSSKGGGLSISHLKTGKKRCRNIIKKKAGEFPIGDFSLNRDKNIIILNYTNDNENYSLFKEINLDSCKIKGKYKIKKQKILNDKLFYFNDKPMLAYTNEEGEFFIQNLKTNKKIIFNIPNANHIYINKNNKKPLVVVRSISNFTYIDLKRKKIIWVHNTEHDDVSVSSSGKYAAYYNNEKKHIDIYKINNGKSIKKINIVLKIGEYNMFDYIKNDDLLIYSKNTIKIFTKKSNWNNYNSIPLYKYWVAEKIDDWVDDAPMLLSLDFSKDGKYLLLGSSNVKVSLFKK